MDAIEAQKELVQLLLKRLKACALECAALHAVFFNFADEAKEKAQEMLQYYRDAPPIQQKVESQFRDLDLVIERVAAGIQEEELRKLLERFDPTGLPN